MATPEQLARFFAALEFDDEYERVRPKGQRPRPVPPAPGSMLPYFVEKAPPRDPYRPIDPAWWICSALVLALIFAAMKMGLQ